MTTPKTFISYSHKDKLFARFIAARLREAGATVWVDEGEIGVGDSLLTKISEGVNGANFVLAMISRNSNRSHWVRKELAIAMNREINGRRVIVLPVMIDNSRPPHFLRDKLYCDLSENVDDWRGNFAILLRSLRLTGTPDVTRTSQVRLPLSTTIPALLRDYKILEHDCGTSDSLRLDGAWPGGLYISLRQRVLGRVLAAPPPKHALHDRKALTALTPGQVLTYSTVPLVATGPLEVRSLATCGTFWSTSLTQKGFCALCHGGDPGTGLLVNLGSDTGAAAAEAILNALSRVKDVSPIERLFEVTPSPGQVILSPMDGVVALSYTTDGVVRLEITDSTDGGQYEALSTARPLVKHGDRVWIGQALTPGEPALGDFMDVLGQNFVRGLLLTELAAAFMRQGVRVIERDLEGIVTLMTTNVKVDDVGEGSPELEGKIVPLREWLVRQQRLVEAELRPMIGRTVLLGVSDTYRVASESEADKTRLKTGPKRRRIRTQ